MIATLFNYIKKKERGFTLIEVIVVLAVFLLIIGVAISIFISIVQEQRRILAQQEILNQVSYVEEYMSKALRMASRDDEETCLAGYPGYNYLLTRLDSDGIYYTGIKFINQSDDNACTEFFLGHSILGDNSSPFVLRELKNSSDDADSITLTSTKLQIDKIKFAINGAIGTALPGGTYGAAGGESFIQPKVTILLGVKIQGDPTDPVRIIQTTISQRNLNVR